MEGRARTDDIIPVLENPELAAMSWAPYATSFQERYNQRIFSYQCFHTGTTTSVRKSTIRKTRKGNHQALVMQTDNGEYYIVISKAQGCDDIKVLHYNFIGWVRRYDGPFVAEAWDPIDNDVDGFHQDMCGDDLDDCLAKQRIRR